MKKLNWTKGFKKFIAPAVLSALVLVAMTPGTAEAHCDSANGPVVGGAKQAIEKNDVKYALPYVGPQYEQQLTEAFKKTMEARKAGGQAQETADYWFEETTVRLHRQTENAPYTGIKESAEYGPALDAAEKAIETGDTAELKKVLADNVNQQVDVAYKTVTETKVGENASVEAKREMIEAQFGFEKYALAIYDATNATGGHEGAAAAAPAANAHNHGAATAAAPAAEGAHAAEGAAEGSTATDPIVLGLAGLGAVAVGVVIGRKLGIKHAGGKCNH